MSLIDELFINSSSYLLFVARRSCAVHPIACNARSVPCNTHSNTHATADAQRGEALLGVALFHLVQQRHQHAGAGSADGMADRDRAAVDVDLGRIPAEVLVDRA